MVLKRIYRALILSYNEVMVSMNPHDRFAPQRETMLSRDLAGRNIRDQRVLEAMRDIPRELFLPPPYQASAYDDSPLPIGLGQTISQPYIVALMTQCLALKGVEHVLEIGTGSGYQTAILARLCSKVYTIERFSELSGQAQAVLSHLDIHNVEYAVGDGGCGWRGSPLLFDRIIITAAVRQIPPPVAMQLAEEGLMIAPVGDIGCQTLMLYRCRNAQLTSEDVCGCRFVPLTGKFGFSGQD